MRDEDLLVTIGENTEVPKSFVEVALGTTVESTVRLSVLIVES